MISELTADRLARDDGAELAPEIAERVSDLLRVDVLKATLADPATPLTDRRALVDAAVAREIDDVETERAAALGELSMSTGDGARLPTDVLLTDPSLAGPRVVQSALVDDDPARRAAAWELWETWRDRGAEFDQERAERLDDLAIRVGHADGGEWLRTVMPVDPRETAADVERACIEPGDDAIQRAVRHRAAGCGVGAEEPAGGALVASDAIWRSRGVAEPPRQALVGDLASAWGYDPFTVDESSAAVGPLGLQATLRQIGSKARAAFRARLGRYGDWTDAAFEVAARELFARAALSAPDEVGTPGDLIADETLGHVNALAPRRAWARLCVAPAGGLDAAAIQEEARLGEISSDLFRRATGFPATPLDESAARVSRDAAAELRGMTYAALLEEYLLTRFGRGWLRDRRAIDWIWTLWEAEEPESAESMARQGGVGNIEGGVLWDAHRPRRR